MCPFKKAFPFVLFLHLLFAVGIAGSFAQHHQVFTLVAPSQGRGEVLQVGLAQPTAPVQAPPPSSPAPKLLPSQTVAPAFSAPAAAPISRVFPNARPAAQTFNAGSIAGDIESSTARIGADVSADTAIGGNMTPPIALRKPKPNHPTSRGQVVVEFTINTQGFVENPVIKESPNAQMAAAVLSILPSWKFIPARQDGVVTSLRVRQVVRF